MNYPLDINTPYFRNLPLTPPQTNGPNPKTQFQPQNPAYDSRQTNPSYSAFAQRSFDESALNPSPPPYNTVDPSNNIRNNNNNKSSAIPSPNAYDIESQNKFFYQPESPGAESRDSVFPPNKAGLRHSAR